ncbi:MAG: DUF4160 domain-containing protein [Bacillota bacterium]
MPTILRQGPYRFFFFSRETLEPPHIHIEAGDNYVKFWLDPVSVASSFGFKAHELRKIGKIVEEKCDLFRRAWDEYFK